MIAHRQTESAAAPPETPSLLGTSGARSGKLIPLATDPFTIGRLPACDLCVRDPHASRRHAEIRRVGSDWLLADLKSRNGTQVNGERAREHLLRHGDEIRIGEHSYMFLLKTSQEEAIAPQERVRIEHSPEPGRTITLRASLRPARAFSELLDRSPERGLSAERRQRHIMMIHEMAQAMVADINQPDLFQGITDRLIHGFEAERACLLLLEREGTEPIPVAASYDQDHCPTEFRVSHAVIEEVLATRATLLCADALADERFAAAESISQERVRSIMCAPLLTKRSLLGLLYVDHGARPREFTEEDLRLLGILAGQVAMMIENHTLISGMRARIEYLEARAEENEHLVVGRSPLMRQLVDTARKVADSNATVLLLGESGTGKEVIAQSIHQWSPRAKAPFVVVNCAALADQLLQSDLFGHERGAFTGAVRQKRGRLELADGGTVFLDEIGELGADLQAKLLRFLEAREFERVGGSRSISVDVRLIAATNRDLAADVAAARFREDLFFRLRVIEMVVPPLRERREDIPALAEHFLAHYRQSLGRGPTDFSPAAAERMRHHTWPGNVRELRNAIERAMVLASGPTIEPEDLGLAGATFAKLEGFVGGGYHERVRELKRQVIREALEQEGGVKQQAARRLGLRPSYLSRLMTNLDMR